MIFSKPHNPSGVSGKKEFHSMDAYCGHVTTILDTVVTSKVVV